MLLNPKIAGWAFVVVVANLVVLNIWLLTTGGTGDPCDGVHCDRRSRCEIYMGEAYCRSSCATGYCGDGPCEMEYKACDTVPCWPLPVCLDPSDAAPTFGKMHQMFFETEKPKKASKKIASKSSNSQREGASILRLIPVDAVEGVYNLGVQCEKKIGKIDGHSLSNGKFTATSWSDCCTACTQRTKDGCVGWNYNTQNSKCQLLSSSGRIEDKREFLCNDYAGVINAIPSTRRVVDLDDMARETVESLNCQNGPYLINMECQYTDKIRGLGAQLHKARVAILYSVAAHLTRVHNTDCFTILSRLNYSDVSTFFGFNSEQPCTRERLEHSISMGLMNVVDYQHQHWKGPWIKEAVRYIEEAVEPATNGFLEVALMPELRQKNTVFRLFGDTKIESWRGSRDSVQTSYEKSFQTQANRELILFTDSKPIRICIHIRRNDRTLERFIPDIYYATVCRNIIETLPQIKDLVQIYLFSDGKTEEFEDFLSEFPDAILSVADSPEIEDYPKHYRGHLSEMTLDHMSHTDFLVMSKSSYSVLAAAMNPTGIKFCPSYGSRLGGISNILKTSEKTGNFDKVELREIWNRLHQLSGE